MDSQLVYEEIRSRRKYPALPVHNWKRQPKEQWSHTRAAVYRSSGGLCQSPEGSKPKQANVCTREIKLEDCHIDHIRPLSSGGSNHFTNLRVLCPTCHALREDIKHKAMRDKMHKKGLLPPNYDRLIWS